ncbi:MAG: response regulator transcription factor [Bacilli bacterium]|nr:response regulator transcription factor [Bacilli bacterium]
MEKKQKNILVVEDDKLTLSQIKNSLKTNGFRVYAVSTASEAIDFCIKSVIDLVLLDLGLPDKDGLYVIQTIRSFNNTLPIIVVSSRTNVESKVLALDAGANDYVTKPFNMDELFARMRKEFRYLTSEERYIFKNGNLMIDYDAKTIYVNGVEVHFTNFEYKIVCLLAYNLGKTLTYEYIINHIWGEGGQDQNGLRVFMAAIRKKISRDEKSGRLIRTDIGTGYRMNKVN